MVIPVGAAAVGMISAMFILELGVVATLALEMKEFVVVLTELGT